MNIAERLNRIPPYVFAEVGARIREQQASGVDVINLGIGSPDQPPPPFIVDAMTDAAQEPANHRYPSYVGSPELRSAMAGYYRRRFGVELDADREVLPILGSKDGIAHIAWTLVDQGDLVLVPDPGYPPYTSGTRLAGGDCYYVPLIAENDFLPDLQAVPADVYERAVAMWINYPNNPTGAVAPLSFYQQLVEYAARYDFVVLSDNPYADVTFDSYRAPSFLQAAGACDVGVEFNSLSKTYNMAGWRIGMAVGNAEIIRALTRVKTNVDTGIFYPLQAGAIAALEGPQEWLVERNGMYQARRDAFVDALRRLDFSFEVPRASLYMWARVPAGWTSAALSDHLFEEAGVWITPGTFYGPSGEGYVRLSLTVSRERIEEACERIGRNLDRGERS